MHSTVRRFALTAALLIAGSAVSAERLDDPQLHFSMDIPAGFKPDPSIAARHPNIVHTFRRPSDVYVADCAIAIERMKTTLKQERRSHLNTIEIEARLINVVWKQFQIDGVEASKKHESGIDLITYEVAIPLKQEAIRLIVTGPLAQKAELRALRDRVLATLDGETNWIPPAAVAPPRPLFSKHRLIVLSLALAAAVLIILTLRRRLSRRPISPP